MKRHDVGRVPPVMREFGKTGPEWNSAMKRQCLLLFFLVSPDRYPVGRVVEKPRQQPDQLELI